MDERRDWRFEFVAENLTARQAEAIMMLLIEQVENFGGHVGGGYWEERENDGEDNQEQP